MKHTQSEITAIKKLRSTKLHPREIQKKNKEAFDKSYFGIILKERNL
jgi:hypothetical protein